MVRFPTPLYHLGRLSSRLAGSLITMAILLLGFETAPGAQEDLRRDRLQDQAVRSGWASTASGWRSSSTRPARSSSTHSPDYARPLRAVRRRQGLRPPGRVAPEPPGGPPLRRPSRSSTRAEARRRRRPRRRAVRHRRRLPLRRGGAGNATPADPRSSARPSGAAWSCPVAMGHRSIAAPELSESGRSGARRRGAAIERISTSSKTRLGRGADALRLEPVDGHLVRVVSKTNSGAQPSAVGAERAGGHQEVGPGTRLGVELEVGHQVALGERVDQPGRARPTAGRRGPCQQPARP